MPTAKYFDKCPPFPTDVPVANVPIISYQLLQQNDPGASSELFQALREYGFFVLDLETSQEGRALIQDAEAMYDLTDETLDLDQDVLNQYPIQLPRRVFGYVESQPNDLRPCIKPEMQIKKQT